RDVRTGIAFIPGPGRAYAVRHSPGRPPRSRGFPRLDRAGGAGAAMRPRRCAVRFPRLPGVSACRMFRRVFLFPRPIRSPVWARAGWAIDTARAQERVVGARVLVAKDGECIYRRAAGFADREAGRRMRQDTLFRLSSVSKVYASVAAMALVAQGRLRLDEPVAR